MPSSPPRSTVAGGFPIAAGAIGGTVLGVAYGQPTAGLLIGLGAGVAAAVAIWLIDRRH